MCSKIILPDTDGEEITEEVLVAADNDEGSRLDLFLSANLADCTRTYLQKLITEGRVTVAGKLVTKSNYRLSAGQQIAVILPPPVELSVVAENIPLDIMYEDEHLIVVNKVQGMVVHPAAGNMQGTLVNALLFHCKDLSGINGVYRPGIVHRIDKDTSGLLVVAKSETAHQSLTEQLKKHTMARKYLALLNGVMPEPGGSVDAPIGRDQRDRKKMAVVHQNSRHAVTHYSVKERFSDYTLVECRLETGRTHQIRVHMAYINHPVVGDPLYNQRKKNNFNLNGQALHAAVLGFIHPVSNEYLEFTAPLPDYFASLLHELRD